MLRRAWRSMRVIAVDLKGHGDSDRPARGYRLADQADEVSQLVQALELRAIRVMGHSWGGSISTLLASRAELPIVRVVLEDPAISVGGPAERRQETMRGYVSSVGLSVAETETRVRATAAPVGKRRTTFKAKSMRRRRRALHRSRLSSMRTERGRLLTSWAVCPTPSGACEVERGGIVGEPVLEACRNNPLIQVVTIPAPITISIVANSGRLWRLRSLT